MYDTMIHSGFVLLHCFLRYWRERMVMDEIYSIENGVYDFLLTLSFIPS